MQTEMLDIVSLFSGALSRLIVEITSEQLGAFEQHMRSNSVEDINTYWNDDIYLCFTVHAGGEKLIKVSVDELQEAWKDDQR